MLWARNADEGRSSRARPAEGRSTTPAYTSMKQGHRRGPGRPVGKGASRESPTGHMKIFAQRKVLLQPLSSEYF